MRYIYFKEAKNKTIIITSKKWLTAILATALLVGLSSGQALPTSSQTISNTGFVYTIGVGVYSNQACTVNVTSVEWGTLMPGQSTSKTAYIKNPGSANTQLTMIVNGWVPTSMQNYLSLSWNATNYVMTPGQVIAATFTLTVASDLPGGSFGFNLTITGQGM
jgi:hypothetical protein